MFRTVKPRMMRASAGRAGFTYSDCLLVGMYFLGVTFDAIGMDLVAGRSVHFIAPRACLGFAYHFGAVPSVLTWITASTKKMLHLTGVWNLAYTVFCEVTSILLTICVSAGLSELRSLSQANDFVLVAFLAMALLLSFLVACFLRPPSRAHATKHRVDDPASQKLCLLNCFV